MAQSEFLPLGTIVQLQGATRRIMIIARGMNVKKDEETFFFDYGGVPYPEGLTGDQMVYFDHGGIAKVYFHGYADDANDAMVTALQNYVAEHPDLKRADPAKWNA